MAPIIEIAVLVAVGKTIGVAWTLLALLTLTVLGTWLMRREGARTWKALREASQTGRMPSHEIADGALVLIGGAFLLLPGFVSDLIGLFFVLPFTRVFARQVLEAFIASRVLVRVPFPGGDGPTSPGAQGTIRGEVVD
ncbi:exclusion suppressor FxsA [Knoellia sinensis KCTC 19936]|uniref:Exclusion suppressor FxsA n=1 Tax=Knoellia sinensis KCTC 19936 TaxID=1385520 RepID=A0A0A0J9C7_9MICO|nr:exclusion suppressor FxsA [Knoellia sinensis KCTC 19936]